MDSDKSNPDISEQDQRLMDAIKENPLYLLDAMQKAIDSENPDEMKVIQQFLLYNYDILRKIPDECKPDWFIKKLIEISPMYLEYATQEQRNNPEIVLAAVKIYGRTLYFASTELKKNIEICSVAFETDTSAIEYIDPELLDNGSFIIKTCKICCNEDKYILHYMSERLKSDPEFLKVLINEYKIPVIKYCAEKLRNDYYLVKKSVKINGMLLEYASDFLRCDYEICITAVRQNGNAIQFCNITSDSLICKTINPTCEYIAINNDTIVLNAIKNSGGLAFSLIPNEYKSKLVIIAYTLAFTQYEYICDEIQLYSDYYRYDIWTPKILKQNIRKHMGNYHNIVCNFYLVMFASKKYRRRYIHGGEEHCAEGELYIDGIRKLIVNFCGFTTARLYLPFFTKAYDTGFD